MSKSKFTTYEWDENITPREIRDRAVECLQSVKSVSGDLRVSLYERTEGLSLGFDYDGGWNAEAAVRLPEFFWLAVYAVRGSSEGHYVHVDLIGQKVPGGRTNLLTLKTFEGMECALEAVAALTFLFHE